MPDIVVAAFSRKSSKTRLVSPSFMDLHKFIAYIVYFLHYLHTKSGLDVL